MEDDHPWLADGGPAFPASHRQLTTEPPTPAVEFKGMSLRDWFAGQALKGMLSHSGGDEPRSVTADSAYAYADAMIKARGQT